MHDLFSWLVMIALLGWLIGYAITAARRDRYVQTLRYIHIYQGKYGPFRNAPPKAFPGCAKRNSSQQPHAHASAALALLLFRTIVLPIPA